MTLYSVAEAMPRVYGRVSERKGRHIPERLLAKLWKDKAARQTNLRTQAGKRVRVVYPGRPGTSAGPDFKDALLEVEGQGLVRGDVELHIRQRDWDHHGHGGDPNYNGVVFHGALQVDSEATPLLSGVQAPVVDLSALLDEGPEHDISLGPSHEKSQQLDLWRFLGRAFDGKGFSKPASMHEAGEALDRAGDLRFRHKARWLLECIRIDGLNQALYQALMEGLGYSSNRRPFIELASRAPYQPLAASAIQLRPDERLEAIRDWLGACSGLFEPERLSPGGPAAPKKIGPAMNQPEWRLFRVRPANHPRRRIMGAASILDRFLERGLAVGLGDIVEQRSPAKLTEALTVPALTGPAFVGAGRAKDLAVNAVLPFMHAWAEFDRQGPGQETALGLYHQYPRLGDNELFREMREQLLPVAWHQAVNNARRQQGLLHLSALLKGSY